MYCDTISNSKRETFRQCRLKYKYNYVNRYEDTDPGNTGALHFGSFIHEVFEHSTNATSIDQLWTKANEIKDKYKFPDKYNKDIEKCFKNFLRFNASLPKESIVEHHFAEEIADGIKHEGYIDRIIKAPTGDILVVDYKTSRREKTKFELFNDPQGKSYVYAAHRLTGVPITKITFAHYYPLSNNLVAATYTESTIRQHIKAVVDDVWTIRKCKSEDLYPQKNDFCNWCSYKSICPLYNDPEVVKGRLDECKTRPRRKK